MASDGRHKPERAADDPASERSRHRQDAPRPDPRGQGTFDPFALLHQGIDEMDHWFGRLGFRPGRGGHHWSAESSPMGDWSPAIEAFQRGSEFVVRAEVPGMNRHDLTVEAGDDTLTIRGERKHEQQESREGMFWSERSYGSFCRVIPLPPGTVTDSAKASFTNGVLEVVMQSPSQDARRGRKIDISGSSSG